MSSKIRDFYTPERFKGRTGYHIFVDRFCRVGKKPQEMEGRILKDWDDDVPNWKPEEDGIYRNNYFYGGNLRGITENLDYIESLNVDLLFLSPISYTHTSHHYDVEDQMQIDPWIGDWDDVRELCAEAHKRDILVCGDLIFNHMGINSKYFQEAVKDKNSPYHQWFLWDKDGNSIGWQIFGDMPQCDKYNPSFQEHACKVAEKYIKEGFDGIRLDLGGIFPKEFLMVLRERVKKINPEALIVVEEWELATTKENPQIDGMQTDSLMNYPFSDSVCRWIRYGNVDHLKYVFKELRKYPNQVQDVLWNHIDSHDTPRATNMLAGKGMLQDPFKGKLWDIEEPWRKPHDFDTYGFREWELEADKEIDMEIARTRLMVASTIQYFKRGIPIVYAGTEIGMTGYKDPFNRKPYCWKNPDGILLNHYRKLGKFRRENKHLLSQTSEMEIEVSDERLEMVRTNGVDELRLMVYNDIWHEGANARAEIYKMEYKKIL